jgi:hypothetical protein
LQVWMLMIQFMISSCLSGFRDHKLMIHVCGLCIQLEDRETLRPHEDGPNNNGNAWFHPKVYAIVHDAKKYPFAAMLDFGKWALGRSISWGICVMTDAGWKIITLENLKENTEKTFAISRFSGSAVGRFQIDLQGLGKS